MNFLNAMAMFELLLVRYLAEHATNLFHRFVLRLGYFLVNEDNEEPLYYGEKNEYIST